MLFCDCKTDEEKGNFFLSGRAVETGVIAPAISNDVAMAYHRCAQFKKENDELRAKIEAMERQEPAGYGVRYVEPTNGEEDWDSIWKYRVFAEDHIKDFTQAYADVGEPVGAITVTPLYALPGAQNGASVPDGWKLVPIVSTDEMDNAGSDHCDGYLSTAQAVWDAMLAAAPEAKP